MPTFKPKNTKKIVVSRKASTTLDGKHRELLDEFRRYNEEVIPALEEEKKALKAIISDSKATLDKKLDARDRLKVVRSEIRDFKKREKDYLLSNSSLVFDYFENKKKIAEGTNKTKMLNEFFNIGTPSTDQGARERSNVQKFLTNVDDSFLDVGNFVVQTDICESCHRGEMIPVEHEGILVCNHCSRSVRFLVENEKPSYKEPPKEVCFYAYKRINHFREILAQFQAKETTQIPDEVLERIKQQIKKERIELTQITNKRAKDILKKLGYNKYYEHIPFIKDKLGIKPPIMSPELEETLCNLFMEIQAPYTKYCPNDRVNFLNYYYTVYKLCELLDQRQFLPFFPMLKDREKRIEQDEIWRKICEELDWEFIPTV